MTCGNTSQASGPCGYTSARFEPFNFLTVPLHVAGGPEDAKSAKRLIVVHLVLQASSQHTPPMMHTSLDISY